LSTIPPPFTTAGGLTELDFIMAAKFDRVEVDYSPKWKKEHPGMIAASFSKQ
jgi:hypothetical protein